MIQDEFVSRWSLLELFQIHSRIKADLPDPRHSGSGEAEYLPTPGLGVGRVGASPDPRTRGWASRRSTLNGSGASDPRLGVGRGGVPGTTNSRTKDPGSDEEEFHPRTGPRVRTAQYSLV